MVEKPDKAKKHKARKKGFSSQKKFIPRDQRDSDAFKEERFATPGKNDVSWYSTTPELLRDAASIPFSWSNGTPIDVNMPTSFPDGLEIPGILTLALIPAVGYADSGAAPINVASTAIYSFVRHANSGHANYDSPDLMLYILAMTDVNAYINYLMRLYSMSTLYAQRNRYLPDALIRANWADPEDIRNNLANFRYGINVLIHKAASLAVPAVMKLFQRSAFLYQNVYSEGDSIKDQLYMYIPWAFRKFQLDSAGAGMLQASIFGLENTTTGFKTVEQLIQYGNDLLDPILSSEDMNIMSGDILKAFGDGGIIKYVELPEVYPIVPVFNIGVLEQIKNAGINDGISTSSYSVKQSAGKNFLVSQPVVSTAPAEILSAYRILTTATYATSPELVMESSRLMSSYMKKGNSNYFNPGSEACALGFVTTLKADGSTAIDKVTRITTSIDLISKLSSFRFHPNVMLSYTEAGATKYKPFFDIDNFAILTNQEIGRLHEAALLSMLNVPSIARVSS